MVAEERAAYPSNRCRPDLRQLQLPYRRLAVIKQQNTRVIIIIIKIVIIKHGEFYWAPEVELWNSVREINLRRWNTPRFTFYGSRTAVLTIPWRRVRRAKTIGAKQGGFFLRSLSDFTWPETRSGLRTYFAHESVERLLNGRWKTVYACDFERSDGKRVK